MTISHDPEILGGDPGIDGTRISVLHIYDPVVAADGEPALVADGLAISLGQVYAALAYYSNNPGESRQIRERRDAVRSDVLDRVVTPPTK